MQNNDQYDKEREEDSGEGRGGQSGKIVFKFKDAASLPPRDDVLPENEIKRLLIVHRALHKDYVDKQKLTRKERAALKEGKKNLETINRQALGQGGSSQSKFKKHPLSNRVQFSGMDKQTIGIPSEYDAETNPEMRDKLEQRLENRLQNRHVPTFHPTPRPRGS